MKKSLLLLLLVCVCAVFIHFSATAEEGETTPPEDSGYSKEFLNAVNNRIGKVRLALKRYRDTKNPQGDALAQAIKDYLKPVDHPLIIDEALNMFSNVSDGIVHDACMLVLGTVKEGALLEYLVARGVRKGKPEVRSLVIVALANGDKAMLFPTICEILADPKENEIVRAGCARALGIMKDARAVNVLIGLDKDKSELVKVSLVEALLNFEDDASAQCIASLINDESSWKVRSAAIQASVLKKNVYSVGYLVMRLRSEKGRLFGDVLQALKDITGVWKGENINAWEQWFKTSEYAKQGKIELTPRADIPGNYTQITYHGIRTHSKNVVFIIDKSQSMQEKCDPKALKGDYTTPDVKFTGETRMELVKWELTRTIAKLDKNTSFNVITYSTDVRQWKNKSVFATEDNKKTAINWVKGLSPEGRTNTWGALLAAFGCKSFGDGRFNANPMGDTIFLLTDGDPNEGELDDPDEIIAGVKELNRYHKLIIHTIAVGRFNKAFLQRLSEEHGGQFLDLGD